MEEHSPEQLADIHTRLVALKEQITALLQDNSGATHTVELDQSTQGRLSRMDAMQRQEMAKAEKRRAETRLKRVEAVLESYDDPDVDFGACRQCGEPIALKRLQALPDALFCVPCAEAFESR